MRFTVTSPASAPPHAYFWRIRHVKKSMMNTNSVILGPLNTLIAKNLAGPDKSAFLLSILG